MRQVVPLPDCRLQIDSSASCRVADGESFQMSAAEGSKPRWRLEEILPPLRQLTHYVSRPRFSSGKCLPDLHLSSRVGTLLLFHENVLLMPGLVNPSKPKPISPAGTLRRSPLTGIEVSPSLIVATPWARHTLPPAFLRYRVHTRPAGLPSGKYTGEVELITPKVLDARIRGCTRIPRPPRSTIHPQN